MSAGVQNKIVTVGHPKKKNSVPPLIEGQLVTIYHSWNFFARTFQVLFFAVSCHDVPAEKNFCVASYYSATTSIPPPQQIARVGCGARPRENTSRVRRKVKNIHLSHADGEEGG